MMRTILSLLLISFFPKSLDAQVDDEFHGRQNTAINFYGKVVDQDGHPIQGALIEMELIAGEWVALPENPKELVVRLKPSDLQALSDAQGSFPLTNLSGHSVRLKSITMKGYEMSAHFRRLYAFSATSQPFRSDPTDPVVFVLWQTGKKPAIESSDNHYRFPPGQPFRIDLRQSPTPHTTESSGDLQVLILRPKEASKRSKYDWSFSIQGENGTLIQPTNRDYFQMPFAPSNGYTNAYEQTYQASGQNWRQAGHMQFYVKLQNGKSSGKVALAWDAVAAANGPDTNLCSMRVRYTINPVGSALTE